MIDKDEDDDYVYIYDVSVKAETDKAILCNIDGDEIWIPLSQIVDDSDCWEMGDKGMLIITKWFAEKEGLD